MDLDKLILKYALQNAVRYKGRANPGNVIPKVLGDEPGLKSKIKEIMPQIDRIVSEVNMLSQDEQAARLRELAPELLMPKEHEERNIFAVLGIKEGEQVKSAFPPGPEKYPHIGHAKACFLNYLLAQKYKGKFVLRFEDTNPDLVKSVFYDMLIDNLSWLGVKWDELVYASDHMQLFYDFCEKILANGQAYVCFCDEDAIKRSRGEAIECKCRSHAVGDNQKFWREMPSYPMGKAIVRLKIDLSHQNSTMRDPTIFRLIDTPHARHGTKYRVWPNYDFQNAIMDGYFGVNYRVRSKEFEMRSELQRYIQDMLGLKKTVTYEFARFNLEGVESSGRVIREKVALGEYIGWDDPRLTTLVALRRRGFLPEAIKNFVVSTGMSKSESTLTWDDLIIHNRRILDSSAKRFFFVHDYERVRIEGAPSQELSIRMHPDNELGRRNISANDEFLLQKIDMGELKEAGLYRLMDCLNFRVTNGKYVFDSTGHEKYRQTGRKIMHFLPAAGNVEAEIMMNDCTVVKGMAEKDVSLLAVGDVIQFERFGFCRLDSIEAGEAGKNKTYKFWFTHK